MQKCRSWALRSAAAPIHSLRWAGGISLSLISLALSTGIQRVLRGIFPGYSPFAGTLRTGHILRAAVSNHDSAEGRDESPGPRPKSWLCRTCCGVGLACLRIVLVVIVNGHAFQEIRVITIDSCLPLLLRSSVIEVGQATACKHLVQIIQVDASGQYSAL